MLDEASLRRAFDGADAVVNLLTHIPDDDRMAEQSACVENDHLRTAALAAIARAARAAVGSTKLFTPAIVGGRNAKPDVVQSSGRDAPVLVGLDGMLPEQFAPAIGIEPTSLVRIGERSDLTRTSASTRRSP